MQIEIITIGDEILSGDILDKNSFFLSKELKKEGYEVSRHMSLPDDEKILKKEFLDFLKKKKIFIVTGGLGPTFDDKTKKVICEVFSTKLVYKMDIAKDLEKRFSKDKYIESQAYVPNKAILLKNEIGTAPGFIFENRSIFIFLPGVALEMKNMFFLDVLGYLKKKFPTLGKFKKRLNIAFLKEVEIEPFLEELRSLRDVKIGIYPSLAKVGVSFSGNREDVLFLIEKLKNKFKGYIFEKDIAIELRDELLLKKKKVAFAESCTGGEMAASFTVNENVSSCFLGSIVSYSNDMKKDILDVSDRSLKEKGAVSLEVVEEMVSGVLDKTDADYGVSISGIAGPGGGVVGKPVGTVCVAIAERGKEVDKGVIHVNGNREFIIKYVTNFALLLLYLRVNRGFFYFR